MKTPLFNSLFVALNKTIPAVLLMGFLGLALATTARAQMTITFAETGGDLIATYSGTLPSWAGTEGTSSGLLNSLNSTSFYSMNGTYAVRSVGGGLTGSWSAANTLSGGVVSGHYFGFDSGGVYAPDDYNGVTLIDGSLTFAGQTFTDLGLSSGTSGSFTLGGGSDPVSYLVGAAVPEPSTSAALFGVAILGVTLARRRGVRRA